MQTTGVGSQASIVGIIRFQGCVEYLDAAAFRGDESRHCVPAGDIMDWHGPEHPGAPRMFGWLIADAQAFPQPLPGPETKGVIGCGFVARALC